ncbi:LOW QUALITY PROTEIN: hypothetical protein HID58_057657, partial [Brassica napus]
MEVLMACVISGTLFTVFGSGSFWILWAVNWRLYSWIFARKWLQGPQLDALSGFLSLVAWIVVVSPIAILVGWGCWLIVILDRHIIGLAIIMAGTALLLHHALVEDTVAKLKYVYNQLFLDFLSQDSFGILLTRAVALLLLLAVALLCAYELCAVYVTAGAHAPQQYSPSGFFFGVSAIALAINMLFICRMVFNGDVDEYVRRAYKFAYSDCIEIGLVACLPEPPDPNELFPRQTSRASHLGLLYLGSLIVLLAYSVLYDWNIGACLYGFKLLQNRVLALFVAGASRLSLICFGIHYWCCCFPSSIDNRPISCKKRCLAEHSDPPKRSGLESQGYESSTSNSANQQILDLNLALAFQEQLNGPRIASMLKKKAKEGDLELTNLLQNKGLDPDFARGSLDADRDHRNNTDITIIDSNSWLKLSRLVLHHVAGTPERAWGLFSLVFILETIIVAIFRPKTITIINSSVFHSLIQVTDSFLDLVLGVQIATRNIIEVEEMALTSKSRKYGFVAWMLSTSVGLSLSFLSKSSVLLGISLTMPLMVACLSVAVPIWMHNRYQFWFPQLCGDQARDPRFPRMKGFILWICLVVFAGSVMALGAIISSKPLDDLKYKLFSAKGNNFMSPYTSSVYLGWAMASGIALVVTAILPIVSWFATYRFSHSSAISLVIFSVVLVAFCGTSYLEVVKSRDDRLPTKGDFLAALLPLACIPSLLSLCCGMIKWKDDCWILSRGLVLLFGAIAAVIIVIRPWTIGVSFLLVLLLIVVAIGVIHLWASNNFYLTRKQTSSVCFLPFLLGLVAFLVGWFQVVYSPRVLPVYVYDAHADCGKNVSAAFLVLYGIALAAEGWGVVASLIVYPPFAGAAVSAITLVVSFGFAVSRPCLTLEMMEVAVRFLSKDTVVQAISRSATKTRNALSGSYSAPQRSASSAALLVEDPSAMRDKAGNFVLPRDDVMKLRHRLKNEERVAGSFFYRMQCRKRLRHDPPTNVDYRRDMCAHAKVLALEEAIDTEWVYMWDKFGGYLLLLLGLTAKAERVQDEVRLRLFLDSIGFSDLSAKKICKWKPEDRRHFEIIQESYLREKEMEEEILMQRREEEGRGKERRKALLEKEERKWKEIEASLIPSIPNAGSREASAMAAAIRAVGGDSVLEDSFARERVCGIARRIRTAQLDRRAQLTGIAGAVCVLDDEPMISGKHCGQMYASVCQSQKISFSITAMIQPDSGPVCLFGTEYQKQVCWEILVAGSEQGIEAGLVGLRLITKGEKQTTVAREWYIGATSITDGRWHTVTITIDADAGEATCYLDGGFDGYQTGLPLSIGNAIWEQGAEVWLGGRLGDCWFLSAVAVLTEVSQISEVIITPEYNEEGIYTVRFCIQGEWVPVVIDDWIPCESPGKPAFATSKRLNELWVSIVEKAYAKLHGSYEALEGGLVQDALVDLTGGAGEECSSTNRSCKLWSQLLRFKQEGFLLGAGSPSGSDVHVSSSGIVQGHAYSVLQVREVDGHRLVQIRNPWANEVEWNGPWSDSSPERSDRMKHKLKHVLQVLSLVTYPFALKYVCVLIMRVQQSNEDSFQICLCLSGIHPREMRYSVDGQWRNCSAGGCQDYSSWHQNPQFLLRATGSDASLPIHVFITLTQLFYIGMRILKTRGHRPSYNIFLHESVGGTDYVNSREISCEMVLDPDPKGYTIVPTTIHPGEEAPFVLSVFTRASVVLEALQMALCFFVLSACVVQGTRQFISQ